MNQNNEHPPEVTSALKAILSVKHPAIDCSLSELRILQDVELYNGDTVIATFVFPFQKIPVKDKLVNSVKNVAAKFGFRFEYIIRYMNETEKKRFLELEKIHWKG
ncbi:MAG: hypothetical protein ACP5D9_20275 [Mariniphaga sp.]